MEEIILVDEHDNELGTMEKMEAHQKGRLHRAFSVFIFNTAGELLLQQRALHKYHSAGIWANTCCSHPRPGENIYEAATRRLQEEMGLQCELEKAFSFIYKVDFTNGLTEHELDHVFIGYSDKKPDCNTQEVADYNYVKPEIIQEEIKNNPEKYAYWFVLCFNRVLSHVQNINHSADRKE